MHHPSSFFTFILLSILGAAQCFAQEFSCRVSAGAVQPLRRSFAAVELRTQVAPLCAMAVAGEFSPTGSNLCPKLVIGRQSGLSIEAGIGWAHRWQKADCSDHNYHTYLLGLMWTRQLPRRLSFFAGPSMFWRSYQSHIGLHRGTLRLNAGLSYRL